MSFCECSLCGEVLTAPQFYKGAPYGSSCIQKVIAMDVPNAGTGKKAAKPKPSKDIYLAFKVDKAEKIYSGSTETVYVWSSEFGKGKFELKNWWGDGFCTLGQAVRYYEDKGIIIVNFGNPSWNKEFKRNNWKWKHDILVRHNLIVYNEKACGWMTNPELLQNK